MAGRLRIGPRSATDRDGATFDPRFGGVGKQTVRDTIPLTKKRTGTIDVDVGDRAVDFWLSTEDLPDPENRVTVDKSGNLTLSYTPNNQVPKQKLYDKLKSMLHHMGMHPEHLIPRNIYMKTDIPIAGCAHQAGTCRFGADAKTSVLDPNCKAHELDNLYVVDTSFFVSIGAVNPSLTAIANAIRIGDHLLQRLG